LSPYSENAEIQLFFSQLNPFCNLRSYIPCEYFDITFLSISLSVGQSPEPIAVGWLKVRRYAAVPEQDERLSLLSIYGYRLAIGYLGVVKGGGVSPPSFLGGFWGWGLGRAVWTPLREVVLIWLASRWGEIAVRILRGGYTDVQGTSSRKTGLALGDFKFSVSVLFLAYRAPA
jgi:hypothetical protein